MNKESNSRRRRRKEIKEKFEDDCYVVKKQASEIYTV
jgi:hypothetical protein